jgi:hypothetical protein
MPVIFHFRDEAAVLGAEDAAGFMCYAHDILL